MTPAILPRYQVEKTPDNNSSMGVFPVPGLPSIKKLSYDFWKIYIEEKALIGTKVCNMTCFCYLERNQGSGPSYGINWPSNLKALVKNFRIIKIQVIYTNMALNFK